MRISYSDASILIEVLFIMMSLRLIDQGDIKHVDLIDTINPTDRFYDI